MRGPSVAGDPARLSDRLGLDSALLGAYVICCGIELVLLPLGGGVNWVEAGPALGLQLVVGGLLTLRLSLRVELATLRRLQLGIVGVLAYLVSVALLRDGASPTAGYGPLVLLPVVWAGLRGARADSIAAVAGVAAVYFVPTALIGPPQYPSGGWRGGLLFVVISTVIAFTTTRLVGEVNALLERFESLARSDELTGLLNRRAWQELLTHELAVARRSGTRLTVALLDLDRFKAYNDTHGHLAGDELLREVAARWRGALRDADVLVRWGGDEFGLLLPSCGAAEGEQVLRRMRAACPEVSFSAGLTEVDRTVSPDAIVADADRALYDAKYSRRESVEAVLA